jgi:pilus assembly protein FimV
VTRARSAKHQRAGLPRRPGAFRRSLVAVALAGALAWPGAASAGLGQIRLLSSPGTPFSALIPLVDMPPDGDLQIGLADRNRYPMLSPYSLSAPRLNFALQHGRDGRPTGILVRGPVDISESELDFAVSIQWASGGAVREYQVLRAHQLAASFGVATEPSPPAGSFANLGLGELRVASGPGQPFALTAELFGLVHGSEKSLRVRVVPEPGMTDNPEAQARLLASMRHAVEYRPDGTPVLTLSAPQPLRTARLAFRLDIAAGRAHLARRYLLSSHGAGYAVAEQTLSGPASAFRVLRVQPGDSLSQIAARLRPATVSLPQAMAMLQRDNPSAFVNGDADRLLAGAELKYPEAWSVTARVDAPAAQPVAAAAASAEARPSRTAAAAAALRARLREQDRLLSEAHAVSSSLRDRLQDLQRKAAEARAEQARAVAAPKPAVAAPERKPAASVLPAMPASPAVMAGGGAAILAAAATALALRRRRLAKRKPGAAPQDGDESSPTVEGMRQWLRYDPTRDDLRYRLLQLLASQDDRRGFLVEAEEARRRFDPDGPMWLGVVRMGRELAPELPWGEPEAHAEVAAAQVPDEPAAPVKTIADTAAPERPLAGMEELEALAGGDVVFRDDLPKPVVEDMPPVAPEPIDNRALAQLYMEMGDTAAANELLRVGQKP